jgi:hypothetical protein
MNGAIGLLGIIYGLNNLDWEGDLVRAICFRVDSEFKTSDDKHNGQRLIVARILGCTVLRMHFDPSAGPGCGGVAILHYISAPQENVLLLAHAPCRTYTWGAASRVCMGWEYNMRSICPSCLHPCVPTACMHTAIPRNPNSGNPASVQGVGY